MKIPDISLGDRIIGDNHSPFIIAEMSGNHNQSLERALALVDAAAEAGAHALKLQTYTADTITLDSRHPSFFIDDPKSLWHGKYLYELYQDAYTPWEWHAEIFAHAKSRGMVAFSSPFDESAVDFLESLDVPAYKIASFENNHIPLLKKVASTGKPVILSTGASALSEIGIAIETLRAAGCKDIIVLQCTSTYPASPENSNVATIPALASMFRCHAGLSDHTMGIGVAAAATALGARVIEKHFTLARSDGGVDSEFSLEPEELKSLVDETRRAFQSVGEVKFGIDDTESTSRQHKRSIYVSGDIARGDRFSSDNIKIVRPGLGLPPGRWDEIIGRRAACDLKAGTPLGWEEVGG